MGAVSYDIVGWLLNVTAIRWAAYGFLKERRALHCSVCDLREENYLCSSYPNKELLKCCIQDNAGNHLPCPPCNADFAAFLCQRVCGEHESSLQSR